MARAKTKLVKLSPKAPLEEEIKRLMQNLQEVESYVRWGGRPRDGWKEEFLTKIEQAREKLKALK